MEKTMKSYGAPPKFEPVKQRDRHIVTWNQQEDDILREQIGIHGTECWTTIAAQFKDKTSRQCRRRWYTYLNSDCKKGGWSEEEDMILCEAQKIFGNRWTEIAKVVSGRTDNAVKNRFATLCKKRAKHDALSKENNSATINQNKKRIMIQNGLIRTGTTESTVPSKKIRTYIADLTEEISPKSCVMNVNMDSALSLINCNARDGSFGECGSIKQQLRPPLAVLVGNGDNMVLESKKDEGTFLKKDDPKITALVQQAELLSSLALKVNTHSSTESVENAWKELQDFLAQGEDSELLRCKISEMDFLFGNFKDLIADFKNSNTESQQSWRQTDLCEESQGSSEYSTGSTHQSHPEVDKTEQHQIKEDGYCTITAKVPMSLATTESKDDVGTVSALTNPGFSSPLKMIPLFRSFGEGIPSPEFSDSERHFILSTLGVASPSSNPNISSLHPPCKRALLHNL